ncbi:MAG: DMT family transporter [Egibacteraceae bacterium]
MRRPPPARVPAAKLAAVLAAMLWGTTGTVQALGPEASPLAYGTARLLVGGFGLVLLAVPAGRSVRERPVVRPKAVRSRTGRIAVVAGALAVYQLCFFAAVQRAGVALGTVIGIGSAPAFAGLLSWLLLEQRPDRRWAGATGLAVVGLAVLLLPGRMGAVTLSGIVLVLGAGLAYAVYALASKVLIEAGLGRRAVMAALFGAGGLLLSPLLFVVDLAPLGSLGGVAAVSWLGLAATTLAYELFARALTQLTAATVATLSLAEPLTAARAWPRRAGRACVFRHAARGRLRAGGTRARAPSRPRALTASLSQSLEAVEHERSPCASCESQGPTDRRSGCCVTTM